MNRSLAAVVVVAVCAAAASAAAPPSGRIVFASASGLQGKVQVWLVRADGSGRRALTPRTLNAGTPALSPDGRRVAFSRGGEIYVVSTRRGAPRRLTFTAAVEGSPAWAPDGRSLAYAATRRGRSAIWKMRADGSRRTRLSPWGAVDAPDWSPDGRRIAYAGPPGRIYVISADGRGRHAVTHSVGGVDWGPAWSPDGRRIAYQSNKDTDGRDKTDEIWLVDADGRNPVRLTHNRLADFQPDWSPDGRWLVFASERPRPGTAHLWMMHPNGKGLRRVTAWAREQYWPSWAR